MNTTGRKTAADYPQELLDLFHEYQHGEISRRDFLDRAKRYAIGGVTVMALFDSLKPNYAFAQQVAKDDPKIKVSYETVDSPLGNGSIKGYFARPAAAGKYPAVLVIHENRGLNPYIEDVARRFALANFVAYAPDGTTSVGGFPGTDEEGAVKFRQVNGPKMFEDFVASAAWLKARPECTGKYGAIGFCFGGGIVNQLAAKLPDLGAGVPFYGRGVSADDAAKVKAPLMLHFGALDAGTTGAWPAYETALKANNKTFEAFIYEGAQHGFHNDTTPRYDEKSAKLAWQRSLDFFNKNLR
ncbi:MAG: dienelactone hydrolase family protein, partial [Acidobacteria bacterium]|nr:dienelactone hydrolase family protein [Acidobacteriota bacterium]MBP8274853.1 dienelactone hydrolase family protein [Acidobacteriota bacterium]